MAHQPSLSSRLKNGSIRLMVLALCTSLLACVPTHTIKPLPNFIEAGVQPGDTIVVETRDGQVHEFVVAQIRSGQIIGDEFSIAFGDIAKLQKKSWDVPESACGGDKPLGCSVPLLIRLASDENEYFIELFHDPCSEHDYCYRHGASTYGVDRDACDKRFLEQMLAACPPPPTGFLKKSMELFDDIGSRRRCLSTADTYHSLVRRFGTRHFQVDTSTYCEYDGPPDEN